MRGYFEVPLSLHDIEHVGCHTLRLNRDSSVNSTWLQSCCSKSRCSSAHLLRPHGGVGSTECRPLAYVHRAPSLMKPITYRLAGHHSSCCQEQLSSLQLHSILCSVSTGC
ncbi:hypothetical protein TNCV_3219321 [Trichonephila clavipes]|nr:hypothetical protein TNCV_3219321 [Trichonephila clavipes]